jgi:excisionase family DNA binding protein
MLTDSEFMTAKDVAERLRVSERTVRRLIATGSLRVCRIGRGVRIRRADLEAFLRRRRDIDPR